jgi:PAS domain S-box-containing protein
VVAEAAEARIVEVARQRLVLTVASVVSDVSYLADQEALHTFLASGDAQDLRNLEAQYLGFAKHREVFDQVRLIHAAGRDLLRIDRTGDAVAVMPPDRLRSTTGEPETREMLSLDRGQVFISEMDLRTTNGAVEQPAKPIIRIATPVFDRAGTKRGMVIVDYRAQRILDRIKELEGDVGQVWLLNSAGYWLLGPVPDAFAFMYPEREARTFAATFPDAWQKIRETFTSGQLTNDLGRFTYAAAAARGDQPGVRSPGWFVVIHTPSPELAARTSELRHTLIATAGVLLLLSAGVAFVFAHHQVIRRESERRIRLSEARLRAVTETASDAIVSADRNGVIRYFNPGAERMFGYSEDEAVGQPLTLLMPERFRQAHTEGLQRYLASREANIVGTTLELVGRRRDGGEFPIDLALASSEVGSELFFTTIIRDITRRAEAERQIQELNQRLQLDNAELTAVNRELEAFSYSVSHDLRAPLRAIDGFSQALVEDAGPLLSAEHHSQLDRVRQAAQRMGLLIDDLIKLARVTRTDINIDEIDLSQMARQIADGLQDSAPERQAEFVVAPDLQAKGDPRLLQVALENLLSNSWKFTAPRGVARIEFGRTYANGELAFFVRDNGVGFDMSYAGKMFGAFQRFHDAREFAGTGIGLATVQRIINKHGGRIWAESQPGDGATFFFTLQRGAGWRRNTFSWSRTIRTTRP